LQADRVADRDDLIHDQAHRLGDLQLFQIDHPASLAAMTHHD